MEQIQEKNSEINVERTWMCNSQLTGSAVCKFVLCETQQHDF